MNGFIAHIKSTRSIFRNYIGMYYNAVWCPNGKILTYIAVYDFEVETAEYMELRNNMLSDYLNDEVIIMTKEFRVVLPNHGLVDYLLYKPHS